MVRKEEMRLVEDMLRGELEEKMRKKKKPFSYRRCVVEASIIGKGYILFNVSVHIKRFRSLQSFIKYYPDTFVFAIVQLETKMNTIIGLSHPHHHTTRTRTQTFRPVPGIVGH